MTDRDILDQLAPWSDEDPYGRPSPHDALAYLSFIVDEVPDLLLLSILETLTLCPWLTGAVVPLFGQALTALERATLAETFPEAGAYLRDSCKVYWLVSPGLPQLRVGQVSLNPTLN